MTQWVQWYNRNSQTNYMYAFDTRIVNVFSIEHSLAWHIVWQWVVLPPGQPDHTPTRVGVPCVPPHSTYLPRSMNTHSLCTQNALHSPASVQITLAGSLPVTQKSTIPLGSEYRNSTDARRTVRITQYRCRRSKSPARATCPYYRGLRDARRVAVPKTTCAGIAAWRICRYNLDTVPDIHANKDVEAGVQTSPFQYKSPTTCPCPHINLCLSHF